MILDTHEKQPVEVEVYSIQFAEDLTAGDDLATAFVTIARKGTAWDGAKKTATYAATLEDTGTLIVTDHDVTLPTATDGYVLSVANASQGSAINVGGYSVPARGAIIVLGVASAWTVEASTTSVLVTAPRDQRVRTFVTGGKNKTSYEVQVTVTSNDGRTLQDEFIVKVKEY